MSHVRMDLSQRDERPRLAVASSAGGQQHLFAIALHALAIIVFGEAKVERASAIAGGYAARDNRRWHVENVVLRLH